MSLSDYEGRPLGPQEERRAFHEENFDTRFKTMGDPAETAFGRLCENKQWPYKRMGLDKVPFSTVGIPTTIRFMPDFLAFKNVNGVTWVECMGTNRPDSVKLKTTKRDVLKRDFLLAPRLEFFVYNSGRYQILEGHYVVFLSLGLETKRFHDGNEYIDFPLADDSWLRLP